MKLQNQSVPIFVNSLRDRAKTTLSAHGNQPGAMYLAMLCGMWSQTFRYKDSLSFDDRELDSCFVKGYFASRDAIYLNQELKAKEEARLKEETKKAKKK